jgi:hypothetical protein
MLYRDWVRALGVKRACIVAGVGCTTPFHVQWDFALSNNCCVVACGIEVVERCSRVSRIRSPVVKISSVLRMVCIKFLDNARAFSGVPSEIWMCGTYELPDIVAAQFLFKVLSWLSSQHARPRVLVVLHYYCETISIRFTPRCKTRSLEVRVRLQVAAKTKSARDMRPVLKLGILRLRPNRSFHFIISPTHHLPRAAISITISRPSLSRPHLRPYRAW